MKTKTTGITTTGTTKTEMQMVKLSHDRLKNLSPVTILRIAMVTRTVWVTINLQHHLPATVVQE